jgi:cell division protein FtsL
MGERYVTIGSTATTDAVTASKVMLALLIALVMSAMKAGPPVT